MENYIPILFPSPHSSSSNNTYLLQPSHADLCVLSELKEDEEKKSESFHGSTEQEKKETKKKKTETKLVNKIRKPRFAFQTRSMVDVLDDGYRWRKYGQKAVKNNKFPRSYYRCTHKDCSVKKQVQRLSMDQEIVVTTYEGVHTHPIMKSNDNFETILNQMQIFPT
ncbi:probable WRKY transcription factor 75 [Phalaenopsis equestris]|uniref:probable WRKY transcription factor 75 n=1 Tax=Phalaenopsis equestris TaxID=78828 RepID=UPI0009E4027C|nr:probable WRKY transcription factor 75 [Phalaenopsis equestris]